MTQQPEAQRLADLIQRYRSPHCGEAAAELRRLDWDNRELRRCAEVQEVEKYASANRRFAKINAQLLEALAKAVKLNSFREFNDHIPAMKAAIAAAKGEA